MAHIREDQYVRDFLVKRTNNIDKAYQDFITDIITSYRTVAAGVTLDIDYCIIQINNQTIGINTPIYFNPNGNNTVTQLPPVITELQPRTHDVLERSEACYKKLKESIGEIHTLPSEENIPAGNQVQLTNILKDLMSKKNVPKRMELSQTYIIGKVLLALKNITINSKEFLSVMKDIGFSRSHSYFLIDFSVLCMKFPKLKTAAVSIREIKTHFSYIKQAVQRDSVVWI